MAGPSGIPSWSITPATNATFDGGSGNWAENQAPSTVNNTSRQQAADIRTAFNDLIWFSYGSGDQASGGTYLGTSYVYASSTSVTIAGVNVTTAHHAGRRMKFVGVSTGTIYGTISSSSFAVNTTINLTWDSGSLTNETLTGYLSQIPVTGLPTPAITSLGALTLTGKTTWSVAGNTMVSEQRAASVTTGYLYNQIDNTSGQLQWGVESSVGGSIFGGTSAYSAFLGTLVAKSLHFGTGGATRFSIASDALSVVQATHGLGIGRSPDSSAGPPNIYWALDVQIDQDGQTIGRITNNSTGTAGEAKWNASNVLGGVDFGITGSGLSPSAGIFAANTGIIHSGSTVTGGLGIAAGAGPILFSANDDITSLTATFHHGLLGIGVDPSNILDLVQTVAGSAIIKLLNVGVAPFTATTSDLQLGNGTSTFLLRKNGASYTTSGLLRQDGDLIFSGGAGGLTLMTSVAQPLYFGVNSSEVGKWDSTRLTIDNALTVTGTQIFTGATTHSAAITYGGVTLSNAVTGTGNMVLSASPTLSGTVGGALTFSGAMVISSLTSITAAHLLMSSTAPTIASGFGTSPSISIQNGTTAFEITVGTGGTDTSGVITLPTASGGWNAHVSGLYTGSTMTRQTASSTTSVTLSNYDTVTGGNAAWSVGAKLRVICFAI